jgi:hypothetical protein
MDAVDDLNLDLVPGFKLIEHDLSHTTLIIPGGYKLRVRRAGPYTFDDLDYAPDLMDPGPFMIKVILMEGMISPEGIEEWVEYRPPEEEPNKDDFPAEYAYYHQWRAHDNKRRMLSIERMRKKNDRLLLMCIKVLDGPSSVDGDDWLDDIKCTVPEEAVHDRGSRMLLFIKTQIIQSDLCADILRELTQVEEVTIEGLREAFDSFRSKMAG